MYDSDCAVAYSVVSERYSARAARISSTLCAAFTRSITRCSPSVISSRVTRR